MVVMASNNDSYSIVNSVTLASKNSLAYRTVATFTNILILKIRIFRVCSLFSTWASCHSKTIQNSGISKKLYSTISLNEKAHKQGVKFTVLPYLSTYPTPTSINPPPSHPLLQFHDSKKIQSRCRL